MESTNQFTEEPETGNLAEDWISVTDREVFDQEKGEIDVEQHPDTVAPPELPADADGPVAADLAQQAEGLSLIELAVEQVGSRTEQAPAPEVGPLATGTSTAAKTFLVANFWAAIDDGDAPVVVQAITSAGVNPFQRRPVPNPGGLDANTPLHRAAQAGHAAVLTALLDHGVPVDQQDDNDETALHYAAWFGSEPCARLLVERGADVDNAGSRFSTPPLMWACQNGHADVVSLLLDMGASYDITCMCDGESPVGLAAYGGHLEVVKILLSRGAQPDKPNDSGYTPAHWAALGGHDDILREVLRYGADANAESTEWRYTPLHIAAGAGRVATSKVLLQHGADLTKAAERDGGEEGERLSPAVMAKENGFVGLGHLMEDWGKLLVRFGSLMDKPWEVDLSIAY
jgi:ankyrin repeat protein